MIQLSLLALRQGALSIARLPSAPPTIPFDNKVTGWNGWRWWGLDHNDGQFFRAMEWLMFFLGHHCRQWFFNGFDKVGPSPLNVFWGVQPLEPMVFRWFSKF